ncbi:RNA polymerase II core subunit [Capsaspora owczarzaki ATCC 30864]|uniref:RNA polymerase II core subunit n=1 Tax=Capsaspora owczarzaki (strain ATCC 30864) TaxID=595528 RepID=A0A0D2VJJ5_CAPO3|nr:RNA polymerase II core subunit [Capsaspora owczarzaki ATCC 30864]KJE90132.1 RNA polymerase II core subunit [Capsaspora owczarzaki ATCC 30864]|eukprot:XP_004364349.1 RNA polymerase II core subunit [Capsaspora owczarzaki ATCC 30864]
MFFYMTLDKEIVLHPKYFGPRLRQALMEKLYTEVEGTCDGERGFIVAITSLSEEHLGRGRLMAGKGLVSYHVQYQAVVFRPVKGEVMDAIVTVVNKMGFFAEAGPISIFVSQVGGMPSEYSFDVTSNPPCFKSADMTIGAITVGSQVRLRIAGMRIDAESITTVGTIKDDYLGFIA